MTAVIYISGFVQNVGFRHFIKSKATELGINGFVRNLPDGRVEAVVQDSKENIEKLIKLCRKGPFLSEIDDVRVEWKNLGKVYKDFKIM